jgi:hypothetical protein
MYSQHTRNDTEVYLANLATKEPPVTAPATQPHKTAESAAVADLCALYGATVETYQCNAAGAKVAFPHSATYSPQDDKLRLYFAFRIPRDQWDALRAAGFVWCQKQAETGGCDMAAVWSPDREDMALELAGEIDDEDQPREERAAQRAERFAGYRDKREGEADALADRYDARPRVHGNQDRERAERAAARHDRIAPRAVTQWGKAEYWQSRTARVISHALYVERADVRHRRIKGLEAELRQLLAEVTPSKVFEGVEYVRRYIGEDAVAKGHDCVGIFGQGRARHPRSYAKASPFVLGARGERCRAHLELRIAYEKQMLAAQGGTSADVVEMVAGGWIGSRQIQKITKDRAGRVSKLYFVGPHPYREGQTCLHGISAEDIKPGSYRAPTAEEAAAFTASRKESNKLPPLVNMDDASAYAYLEALNATQGEQHRRCSSERFTPATLLRMTSAEWARMQRATDSYQVVVREFRGQKLRLRVGLNWLGVRHVVVLSDKPVAAIAAPVAAPEAATVSA